MNFIKNLIKIVSISIIFGSYNNSYAQTSPTVIITTDDLPENNSIIIDKPIVENIEYDSVTITVPYAVIKNKKLKALVDSLHTVDSDYNSIPEPVYIYLMSFSKDQFCAWEISPDSSMGVNDLYPIAYYKKSNLYILLSSSMKRYLKFSKNKRAEFILFGKYMLSSVDYTWCCSLKKSDAKYNRTEILISDKTRQKNYLNSVHEYYTSACGK